MSKAQPLMCNKGAESVAQQQAESVGEHPVQRLCLNHHLSVPKQNRNLRDGYYFVLIK